MTLAVGDHVVKLDRNTGLPVDSANEAHIEFEVEELIDYKYDRADVRQTVRLRKVR